MKSLLPAIEELKEYCRQANLQPFHCFEMDNALFRPLGNISQLQKALQPRFCDAE